MPPTVDAPIPPHPPERPSGRAWVGIGVLALVPSVVLFALLVSSPWDAEFGEGLVDFPARRGGGLDAIFPPPDGGPLPYPCNYTPLHFMATAVLARWTGLDSLPAGRVVSLLGAALAVWAIVRIARQLGAGRAPAIACGLLLPVLQPMAAHLGLDRTDGLALGLLMVGAMLVVESAGPLLRPWRALAGMSLAVGATLCNQRYVLSLPALGGLWLLRMPPGDRRSWNGAIPLGGAALFLAAAVLALNGITQGRAWFYMVTLPGAVPLSASLAARIFLESAVLWGPVWVAAVAVASRLDPVRRAPLILAAVPFLGNLWLCLNIGASRNYFLPVTAACLPYLAVGLSRTSVSPRVAKVCGAVFLVWALGHAVWTGASQVPRRRAQMETYRRAEEALRGVEGPIFSSNYFAHLSRTRPAVAQTNWVYWLTKTTAPALWERDSRWLRDSVREGRFSMILLPIRTELPLEDQDFEVWYRPLPAEHPLSLAYGQAYARKGSR